MKLTNQPVFPSAFLTPENMGLTKREHYAGLAMQAIIAECGWSDDNGAKIDAQRAVIYADALIAELEKKKP